MVMAIVESTLTVILNTVAPKGGTNISSLFQQIEGTRKHDMAILMLRELATAQVDVTDGG